MYKNSPFYLIFLVFFATPVLAQLEFYDISPELLEGAHTLTRSERQTFEVQSIGKATETYYISKTIFDAQGNEQAVLAISYSDLQKIKDIRATLYDKFGKQIRKLKEKDFQDLSGSSGSFFSDVRIKAIDLSYTDYPYTIEFEYEIQHDGLLFYPVWQPQAMPGLAVQESTFEVTLPSELNLRYKTMNLAAEPDVTESGEKHYQWRVSSLPAYDAEPYTPVAYSDAPRVYTAPYTFEIEGFKGDMSSWASFGKFFNQLNEGTRELPAASVKKFQAMTADCADELCKIKKLYAHLQETTRYVSIQLGIGGWRPMPAAEVDEHKYGDCKALSNYFCAMLDAVGVKGYYTLIRGGRNYNYLQRDFPSSQFNHVVVCIPQGQDTIWAECTSQTAPLGYSGSFTGNRDALMITPEGGKLVKTPTYKVADNEQDRTATLTIDAQGNAQIDVVTIYSGLQQEYASHLAEMPEQKRRDELYDALHLKNFEILAHQYQQEKTAIPKVAETLRIQLPGYAGKSGKRLFVSPNVLPLWNPIPQENKERARAIQIAPFPFRDKEEVVIEFPMDYKVEYLPEEIELTSPFGNYRAGYKEEDGRIVHFRYLEVFAEVYASEMYGQLVDFCKQINKADARRLVLVQAAP